MRNILFSRVYPYLSAVRALMIVSGPTRLAEHLVRSVYGISGLLTYLKYWLRFLLQALNDRCYFRNPQVSPKTPELQGENVIVLPKGQYYGHGIGITSAEQIIRILNANRIEDATESAYFMENSAARPNFKRLADASPVSDAPPAPAQRPAPLRWRPFPRPITG